jgi:hypothetical protein
MGDGRRGIHAKALRRKGCQGRDGGERTLSECQVRGYLTYGPWSSAGAHLAGCDDRLIKVAPLLALIGDWRAFLDSAMAEEELANLRNHSRTGRPLGDRAFVERLEATVGRIIAPQKRGPKPKKRFN